MVAYVYAADRKSERAEAHLGDFAGILQVDGYGGYNQRRTVDTGGKHGGSTRQGKPPRNW